MVTPYSMAYPETYQKNLFAFDIVINTIFFFDIIINFFTAYFNSEFEIVDKRKVRNTAGC